MSQEGGGCPKGTRRGISEGSTRQKVDMERRDSHIRCTSVDMVPAFLSCEHENHVKRKELFYLASSIRPVLYLCVLFKKMFNFLFPSLFI